jgi:AcrR family transcriptional regulator
MIPEAQRRKPTTKGASTTKTRPSRNKKRAKAHVSDKGAPRRTPFQERARFTVAAILQAAAEVIDEVGWAHASTNRIAERAGVSIGSLYQYFANKEEILATLMEEHRKDVHVVVGLALDRLEDPSVPIKDALRSLFADLMTMHRDDPVLTRVLATEVPHQHGTNHHGAKSDHLVRWLQRVLEERPDVAVGDTAAAAHVVATSIEALTRWLVHEAPDSVDTRAAVEEMVRMYGGYLSAPKTGP